MMVGTKSIATLSTGYLNALDYAKQRVQGADLTQQADKTAPRVTITHHPDVRRSLMLQKAYAEGLRALVLYTATQQDIVEAAQLAAGSEELPEDSPAELARRVNDLLLPVVKALRLRAGLGAPRHRVAADARRVRVPPGLPDRAVRPGRQDRHPLRGHHGDPGARLLLPQDRQGPGRRRSPTWRCRSRSSPRTWERQAARSTRSASCSGRRSADVQGILEYVGTEAFKSDPRMGGEVRNVYKVGLEHLPAAARGRRPRGRLAAAA